MTQSARYRHACTLRLCVSRHHKRRVASQSCVACEPYSSCTILLPHTLTNLPLLRTRGNELVGTLEPLRGCRFLQGLGLACNQITGGLEPLTECTELQGVDMRGNQLTGGLGALDSCSELQVSRA